MGAGPCSAVGRAFDGGSRFDAWSGHIPSFLLLLIEEGQLSVAGGCWCVALRPR